MRECFNICDNHERCDILNRCSRIASWETVPQAKSDAASLKIKDAPYGWIWLDDDGWEHDADSQHPQKRGEAQFGMNFRPATRIEAGSPDFFRPKRINMRFGEG